ncbi:hypothetical protein POL68_07840 [Stigmatella sp. ncwal1]|uniref:Uncharacterized protein n=1 Tax=Stigmatella ashevillensis TaxID=2995309 RepID=A0ABT5D3X7_9BACT|nr:hypothetical protein [Stigmatella ashevillena]MDC0708375.1 hypothetical protein [Stigmatella ashevillena]
MRPALLALALVLVSQHASAQIFNPGAPPSFKDAELDKRFAKSKLNQALTNGTQDANCAQLVGGLMTLLGETAPYIHKRDENFYLDPVLVQALNTQLSNPRFPGTAYFIAMLRRVLIDQKLSQDWLDTAAALAPYAPAVDLGKLRFLADGVNPIDSFLLTLPVLRERYEIEVVRANATAASTAEALFRDTYVDREVVFGGLEFLDAVREKKKKPKKKKRGEPSDDEPPALIARLVWYPVNPNANSISMFGAPVEKPKGVPIAARLKDAQYVNLDQIPKGTRLLVRGRFWEYKKGITEVEVRDAQLFLDRDWSQFPVLVDPNATAACPLAINELTGTAPVQPGAFGQNR